MSKPVSEHDMAFSLPIDAFHSTDDVHACRASDIASAYHLVVFFAPPTHEVLVGVRWATPLGFVGLTLPASPGLGVLSAIASRTS